MFCIVCCPTLNVDKLLDWSPTASKAPSPRLIDACCEDNCKSPSPAFNSNLDDVILKLLSLKFNALLESPIWNSASVLLFANQNPSVKSVADDLPLLITPCVLLPVICIALDGVLPKFPKPTPKPEFLKPGVDIPGISPKGIRLRIGDDLFRKLFPNIKFKPKGSPPKIRKIKPDIKKIEERQLNDLLKQEKYLQEQLKKLTNSKTIDEAKRKVIQQFTERLVEVTKQLEGRTIPKKISPNLKPFVRPSTNTNNLRVEAPTNDDDNFIALAPTNNIFLMNQEESNQSTPITEGSDTFLINRGSVSAYDVAINMAQIELLQTV